MEINMRQAYVNTLLTRLQADAKANRAEPMMTQTPETVQHWIFMNVDSCLSRDERNAVYDTLWMEVDFLQVKTREDAHIFNANPNVIEAIDVLFTFNHPDWPNLTRDGIALVLPQVEWVLHRAYIQYGAVIPTLAPAEIAAIIVERCHSEGFSSELR